jgi:hypothetical protein
MTKTAQPRWAKEVISNIEHGRFSKGAKIVKKIRKGMGNGEGSTLKPTSVLSSKHGGKRNENLSHKMTLGDERRRLAKVVKKKSVRKSFHIEDKVRGA